MTDCRCQLVVLSPTAGTVAEQRNRHPAGSEVGVRADDGSLHEVTVDAGNAGVLGTERDDDDDHGDDD